MRVHSVFPQSTIMQKLLQLSALKATKNLFVFFFYKMQLCNFWPDSELLIAWLRWNGWVTNWLCRKQILSKKCRSIAFKIGTTIDIDTFLVKRSRTDLILGLLKVSKNRNDIMKTSFLPKTNEIIVRISAHYSTG